jgi:hypothetical protein
VIATRYSWFLISLGIPTFTFASFVRSAPTGRARHPA